MNTGEMPDHDLQTTSSLSGGGYNLGAIRDLVKAAFEARELRRFCQDHPALRPLVDRFGVDLRLEQMADDVVEYCRTRSLFPELLAGIREQNPAQYERHFSLIHAVELPAGGRAALDSLAGRVRGFAQGLQAGAQAGGLRAAGPYRGLMEYRLGDAALFFGRDRAIEELVQQMERGPLTVLHAESGAGKTSLLKAGISARLLDAGHLPIYVRAYDTSPALALKRVFFPRLPADSALGRLPLRSFLGEIAAAGGPEAQVCLMLDQFEDFFLHLAQETRAAFVEELADCLEAEGLPVRWLIALRGESLSELARFRPRIRDPLGNDYHLAPLSAAEAREAIVRPAEGYGTTFAPNLVERILDDLGRQAIAPPQVQLVCQALYQALEPGETGVDVARYEDLGGAAGILRDYLEQVLRRNLPRERRAAARTLIEALITSGGRRALRSRAELSAELAPLGIPSTVVDQVLAQLLDSRLIHLQERDTHGVELAYELVHDYLVEQVTLSPEVKARKAAGDLLRREVLSWEQYGALMRPQTLQVVAAQRELLAIDGHAAELLARSALETGEDLAGWLDFVPAGLARQVLLEGLAHAEPRLRARAARHLDGRLDAGAEEHLVRQAIDDGDAEVRAAAFQTLASSAPARAREVLLRELEHSDAGRRAAAARAATPWLDETLAGRLYALAVGDRDEQVWAAALETLASAGAAPYRDGWRPLLRAGVERQAEAFRRLRRVPVELPASFRWRTAPARAAQRLRHEARTRPLWLAAGALLVVALYLGLAWLRGWPPLERWQRFEGAPQTYLNAVAVTGEGFYVASRDYGLSHWAYDGSWSPWLAAGLPTGTVEGDDGGPLYVHSVDALAVDPAQPGRIYAALRDHGLYASQDAGAGWHPLWTGPDPANSWAWSLAVRGRHLLLSTGEEGLYASGDGGESWQQLGPEQGAPGGEVNTVRFAPGGTPYVGGVDGLYRGTGDFPWHWEKIAAVPSVIHMDIGPDGEIYLALGWPRAVRAACYLPGSGLGAAFQVAAGDEAITQLAAHPREAGRFYLTTTGRGYEMDCRGIRQKWQHPDSVHGPNGLAVLVVDDGDPLLLQANSRGLFYRRP